MSRIDDSNVDSIILYSIIMSVILVFLGFFVFGNILGYFIGQFEVGLFIGFVFIVLAVIIYYSNLILLELKRLNAKSTKDD